MKTFLHLTFQLGVTFVCVDIAILLITMYAIGMGTDVPHISFWDTQIHFVLSLLG